MKKHSLDEKRRFIADYLKKHKTATTHEIKQATKIKVERVFRGGIREAYTLAKVRFPKHLQKRSRTECENLVIDYIISHREAKVSEIESKLGVNIRRLFGSIKNAYKEAKVEYTRASILENKKKAIISKLRGNPLYTEVELNRMFRTSIAKSFGNFKRLCRLAGVEFLKHKKRRYKKQIEILDYIQKNPDATQWEINKNCHTHVQVTFEGGIREAFSKAGVEYPYHRRILYGTAKLSIKRRSLAFQKAITELLKEFGIVRSQVRTKNGVVDAILQYKNTNLPIEIKDYRVKPVSQSEIKQLLRYMEALGCGRGLIISSKGTKKEFNINSKRISVVPAKDLDMFFKGAVV